MILRTQSTGEQFHQTIADAPACQDHQNGGAFRCARCGVWVCMFCEGSDADGLCDLCWATLDHWTDELRSIVYPPSAADFHQWGKLAPDDPEPEVDDSAAWAILNGPQA